MKRRTLLLLPSFAVLCLGTGPCPQPQVISGLVSVPGYQQPQTPGSGLPGEFTPTTAVTQLLGPGPNLNRITYLRTRLEGALATPAAILILVPGFLGAGTTFGPMAEQLVSSTNGAVEVWSIDRRPNQLEDPLGGSYAAAGAAQGNLAAIGEGVRFYFPDVDLDGDSISDGPFPIQDPFGVSRTFIRMSQDDMRFAAYWGIDTYARDWKLLVDAAREIVGPEGLVLFGGHSAGTGFAGIFAAYDFDPTAGVDAAYQKIDGLLLLEGGGPGAPSPSRPSLATYQAQVASLATTGGPEIFLQNYLASIDVPSLGAAAMVAGVAALYDPTGPSVVQATPIFGAGTFAIVFQSPLSNETAIGAFIDDDFSLSTAFRASVGFSDDGPNQALSVPGGQGELFYFMQEATGGGVRQWKNFDDPTLPQCPPNVSNVGVGCALLDNGLQAATPPATWGHEREVTDIKDISRVQFTNGNFAEWYYLSGRVSLDSQYGRDSSSLGNESLLAITQNANMNRPVLAIGGSNGLAALPSSWNGYFGSIATPAADKEIAIIEGYAHLDVLTAKHNDAVPIIKTWVLKLLGRKLTP
jgi:hypothetical protein